MNGRGDRQPYAGYACHCGLLRGPWPADKRCEHCGHAVRGLPESEYYTLVNGALAAFEWRKSG